MNLRVTAGFGQTETWVTLSAFAIFALTGPISNLLIQYVGTVCVPGGPCLIPVFPGVMAPSGVLVVGLALVLRDIVHNQLGPAWALGAIMLGGIFSATFSPGELVFASTLAFLISELVDFAVYVPLRRRGFFTAALISSIAGLLVDSVSFLYVAFGSLEYMTGQIIGKALGVAIALVGLWVIKRSGRQKNWPVGPDVS